MWGAEDEGVDVVMIDARCMSPIMTIYDVVDYITDNLHRGLDFVAVYREARGAHVRYSRCIPRELTSKVLDMAFRMYREGHNDDEVRDEVMKIIKEHGYTIKRVYHVKWMEDAYVIPRHAIVFILYD